MKRVVLLFVVLASCTADAVVTTTTVPPVAERLIVLEDPGTLLTMDSDGEDRVTVVDASDRIVLQPTWSPGGERLAWTEVVLGTAPDPIVVITALPDGSDRTTTPVSNPPFYLSWSPDGDRLMLLRNGSVSLDAGLIDVAARGEEERVLSSGQPFYFSWNASGNMILAHVGTGMRLETINLDGEAISLGAEPGGFQAPVWQGDRAFWILEGADGSHLVTSNLSGDEIIELATITGFVHFVVSPDGARVAYSVLDEDPPAVSVGLRAQPAEETPGSLIVLDVESGDTAVVDSTNAFSFFWSPDSSKLLVLSASAEGFIWRVWDEGSVTDYETFLPSPSFGRDYLPFFDQFAQSIELWSPDSQSFVYAGRASPEDQSSIWVQPLDGPVREISDGVFAAFVPAP